MALPLTKAYTDEYPVGEKSWTCFLNAQNFKGPLAYYVPETWAKILKTIHLTMDVAWMPVHL